MKPSFDTADAPLNWSSPIILALLGCGALLRLAWNVARDGWSAGGEAFLVAIAISEGRGVADAYGVGTGATAHIMPTSAAIAGGVYALLGYSQAAEFVLAAWSIGLALGTYLLLDRAFALLGVPARARLIAFAFLCLIPTYIAQEAVEFRVWEGGLAAFLSALMLTTLLTADRDASARRPTIAAAVLAPLIFVVQPLLGLAAFAGLIVLWAFRIPWLVLGSRLAASIALLALLVAPWAIRNQQVMGAPVLLRSNGGLELALAHYPGAGIDGDRGAALWNRLHVVHPLQASSALAAMRAAGGEVAYSRALGQEAAAWIDAHPQQAARIMLAHVGDAIAPGEWIFLQWGNATLAPLQSRLATAVALLGVLGLALGLWARRRPWLFVALPIVLPIIIFAPFQPGMRFAYLFYAPLAFCALGGPALLIAQYRRRRSV